MKLCIFGAGAMGGWISSTLVRLGDLKFEFLPPDEGDDG